MSKAAVDEPKRGYEAVPVVNAAAEAAQFMISGGNKPAKTKKVAPPIEERSWEGHLCCWFGRCDAVGWSACCMSYFVPCFAFGCVPPDMQTRSAVQRTHGMSFCFSQLRLSALCALLMLGAEHACERSLERFM